MYISNQGSEEWFLKPEDRATEEKFKETLLNILQEEDIYIVEPVACSKQGRAVKRDSRYHLSSHAHLQEKDPSDELEFDGAVEVRMLKDDGETEGVKVICHTDDKLEWIQALWKYKGLYEQAEE